MSKQTPQSSGYTYFQTVAMVVSKGPIKRIRRVWFDNDVVYDDRPEQSGWSSRPITADGRRPALASYLKSDNIEVFLGSQTQLRSPTLEALLGTANCPANRGRAGMVWKDLPIHKWGGRQPSMTFELESLDADANGQSDLVFILNDICDMAGNPDNGIPGIPSANRDFTQLAGVKVDGFLLSNRAEARQHLAPLQDAFMFDFAEVDFKLTAVTRGRASVGTLNPAHIGAGTPDPQPEPFTMTRTQQLEIPQKVDAVYQSAAIDFQNFTQSTSRESTLVRKAEQLNIPVVMSETAAMAVARRVLAMRQVQRDPVTVCVPPYYLPWAPGDCFDWVMANGLTQQYKIVKQLIGLFGHIELTVVPDDRDIYTLTGDGAAPPGGGGGGVDEAFAPVIYAGDLNAIVSAPDASFDGCNLIIVIATARTNWGGATSKSNAGIKDTHGVVQHTLTSHTVGGSIGNLTATLGKYRGPSTWDTVNTITVQLARVYVASATPAGTNTGNGTIVMGDPSTSGGAIPGTYTAIFTSSTAFTVRDPSNVVVGTGTTGTQFGTEVVFKITAGSTAFVSGDKFNILVTAVGAVAGDPPVGSTDLDVLNGANVLVCEGEIVQFVSAVDLGNDTYLLSRLLRGRRGTEYIAWNDHAAGATVAFLDTDTALRFKAHLAEVGNTKTINAFDAGKADASYTNTPHVDVLMQGNVRKPWSPGGLGYSRGGGTGNDLICTWTWRSRWGDDYPQLGETLERYDFEVWDSTFTTLKRTVSALTTGAFTYTDAMQTADWGVSPKTPLGLVIYQVSALVGRGFPLREVVTI